MKLNKAILGIGTLIAAGIFAVSADHIDAPAVKGGTADIADFYAFQGENANNLVFVANLQGLLSPAASSTAKFDEGVLVEFNIDNTGDAVEDLVIQAIPRNGKMYFFGPAKPTAPGTMSTILTSAPMGSVDITSYGGSEAIGSANGMKYFAGPRDDPFFFDIGQYTEIINGRANGFKNPGTDTFAGSNVMSIIVEVPKSMLGTAATLNTWVESKKK